ncbi:U2 small nuclear RNA auxiliary factor 2 [Coelomomyces lativittatus]|nr:U2 small nuclear RNA auxiliary factor 2 [Coelomomyces lativittatus]
MALDGIMFRGHNLKVRRPKDYVPQPGEVIPPPVVPQQPPPILQPPPPQQPPPIHTISSNTHQNNPDKLFIGGIPHNLTDEQIKELLLSFGGLKAFSLIKDSATGQSKGYAFCEFIDGPTIADLAIEGLHNMEIGERRLVVQRASSNCRQQPPPPPPGMVPTLSAAGGIGELSQIMLLLNMASSDCILVQTCFNS